MVEYGIKRRQQSEKCKVLGQSCWKDGVTSEKMEKAVRHTCSPST
jgi:hypothetical protein